ncbi:Hypothetical_protein [Hexamita inflata]|uniref:Hypothetical_protein n=1 Tax=Hexamita inflata TaxID=28002 RepID=A0AA86PIW8_9EUKA|nr:Hypothetical protein HINF_LOCUS28039 [Hexamita inflata]
MECKCPIIYKCCNGCRSTTLVESKFKSVRFFKNYDDQQLYSNQLSEFEGTSRTAQYQQHHYMSESAPLAAQNINRLSCLSHIGLFHLHYYKLIFYRNQVDWFQTIGDFNL